MFLPLPSSSSSSPSSLFVVAVSALLVAAATLTGAKTVGVVNLDHHTMWKVVRQGRLVVVKFEVEHPHGLRQENWVELAELVGTSPGLEDVLLGEVRIKDSDSEPGGRSPNIPLWDYFNFSLTTPPHMLVLIPNGRVDWSVNHSDAINVADDDEFPTSAEVMTPAHQFHQALRVNFHVKTQFTAGLGARWINAVLRRYPELDKRHPRTAYPLEDAQPIARHILGNHSRAGGFVTVGRGIAGQRCAALATGPGTNASAGLPAGGWRALLRELEQEAAARVVFLAEKERIEKEQDALIAAEAAAAAAAGDDADEVLAQTRLRELKELERVENTNDGKRQRKEAAREARLHRERTWLIDLLRKMLGIKRCPAKPLPQSRVNGNEDRAARLEESCPEGTDAGAESGTVAFTSAAIVRAEERKLRFVARSQWLSMFTRLRADFLLSALWCAKRHFTFGPDA